MFPGFPTRLQNDMDNLYKQIVLKGKDPLSGERKVKIQVMDPPRRKYNVFIGGGVFARAMQNNAGFWITQQEWAEEGRKVVNRVSGSLK
jgi:actin-related protein 2